MDDALQPMSIHEARAAGIPHYFTGTECKYGHIDFRLTSNGECLACKDAEIGLWRRANREAAAMIDAEWAAKKAGLSRRSKAARLRTGEQPEDAYRPSDIDPLNARQGYMCAICGEGTAVLFHVDHIIPVARGGSSNIANIQILCPPCNLSKGAKMPANDNSPTGSVRKSA